MRGEGWVREFTANNACPEEVFQSLSTQPTQLLSSVVSSRAVDSPSWMWLRMWMVMIIISRSYGAQILYCVCHRPHPLDIPISLDLVRQTDRYGGWMQWKRVMFTHLHADMATRGMTLYDNLSTPSMMIILQTLLHLVFSHPLHKMCVHILQVSSYCCIVATFHWWSPT